jgi:thimet oligopeptidase
MKLKTLPLTKKDLIWIEWTPAQIDEKKREIIQSIHTNVEEILRIPEADRTFENTIWALHQGDMSEIAVFIDFLMYVSTEKKIRDASQKAAIEIEGVLIDAYGKSELYETVCKYAKTKEAKKLIEVDKKLLQDTLKNLERSGLGLSAVDQKEFRKTKKKITKLESVFGRNINEYNKGIWVTESQLEGLAPDYIARLPKKDDKYFVSVSRADYGTFMSYAESEPSRKKLAMVEAKKGGEKNIKILEELMRLRTVKAKMLGYKNFSDFTNKPRMAGSKKAIMEFLKGTHKQTLIGAQSYVAARKKFARKESGDTAKVLDFYETDYWSRKYKESVVGIDEQELKKYFTLESVLGTMFTVAKQVFGVSIVATDLPAWHKDVTLYKISVGKELRGYIGMDLFPREGKYSHAAMFDIHKARAMSYGSEDMRPAFGVIVQNLPKPSKSHPSLLTITNVITLFHEFGHALHETLTRCVHAKQSGASTVYDFVELPSQMMEEFAWDPKYITMMARHYETGKKLPKEMLEKMISSKSHGDALLKTRQLAMSIIDQEMYEKKSIEPLQEFFERRMSLYIPEYAYCTNGMLPAGWGHVGTDSYGAGYYAYIWSLVYAKDCYSKFANATSVAAVGKKYRKEIFETGSSREEMVSLKKFLGRKPNNKAFIKELGIGGKSKK